MVPDEGANTPGPVRREEMWAGDLGDFDPQGTAAAAVGLGASRDLPLSKSLVRRVLEVGWWLLENS